MAITEQSSPVTIKYKGADIAVMDDSGTKTIKTSGKYCEADIEVVYVASDTPTPTQDKSANPSTSAVVVTPDTGKLLSSVTINPITSTLLTSLDADFTATNIKKDVNMFGLVGTFEGGGGGGGQVTQGVFFLDYDGTVVEAWATADVSGKTALPSNPSHTRLVAQGWNWDLASIKSYITSYPNANVYVGQMYKTASGLTEIDVTVTKVTGLAVTCKMAGTKNWGDGTTDSLTSHTYTDYGDYTITCNGTSIPAGSSSNGGMFGTTSSNMNRFWCTAIRIGENVKSIGNYAFHYCFSLTSITIPQGVTSIGNYAFYYCYSLTSAAIPQGVTSIGNSIFCYCISLTSIAFPHSVGSIGTYIFQNCFSLTNITIPQGVTSIGNYTFYYCYSLTNITVPQSVTSIGNNAFYYCYSLTSATIPQGVRSIGNSAFYNCSSLTSITIPQSVTSIGTQAFQSCYSILEYDFTSHTAVPTLSGTNALTNINGLCKILVPANLYPTWTAATNWTTYANYIYGV